MSKPRIMCPQGAETLEGARASGDYSVKWTGQENATFRLVEINDGIETILYEGSQLATTMTGKREGDYEYKVGVVQADTVTRWSEQCTVMVRPYTLSLAFTFFGFGLLVTLATAWLIIRGHGAHRRGEIG